MTGSLNGANTFINNNNIDSTYHPLFYTCFYPWCLDQQKLAVVSGTQSFIFSRNVGLVPLFDRLCRPWCRP